MGDQRAIDRRHAGTLIHLWTGDEDARQVVEQLNRDAGYEPVCAGPLEIASVQEDFLKLIFGIAQGGMGMFLYQLSTQVLRSARKGRARWTHLS